MAKDESFFDSRAAVLASIPHRPPFLFIDDIVKWLDNGVVCVYRFKKDEYFFEGHYPDMPIVPGVILCEAAMQAGAVYTARIINDDNKDKQGKFPVVGRMNNIKFKNVVKPGQLIEMTVVMKEKIAGAYIFKAKTTCEEKPVVSFEFIVTLIDKVEDGKD
ncbi:MAG: 3-hydroxyacyl-ACP dehydratase FabZ family protein [Thermoguttaceae bacterium]|jgi:3-hydroxyacyl-[acyl-carrier-protein] dehydratase